MLIFTDKTGQLGNQLFEFSTFIAKARQTNSKLYNYFFNDYGRYFEGYTNGTLAPQIITSSGNKTLDAIVRRILTFPLTLFLFKRFNRILRGDGNPQDISNFDSSHSIYLKRGSWFTDFGNFYRHADFIKRYFSLLPERAEAISRFYDTVQKEYDIVVGLHIRRGDYATFLDGKFHFSDSVYHQKILETIRLFPGKKVGVIVCSNEKINLFNFPNVSLHQSLGHFIDDIYTLAKCDYILGPPSTYTMWASFYGSKPLYKIRSAEDSIKLEKFIVDYGY